MYIEMHTDWWTDVLTMYKQLEIDKDLLSQRDYLTIGLFESKWCWNDIANGVDFYLFRFISDNPAFWTCRMVIHFYYVAHEFQIVVHFL